MAAGQGRGEGGDAPSPLLAASPGKASLKPRWVPRWEDGLKSMGPCDTCRKEWFSAHPSGGLSPWSCRPCPALLREKAAPGGGTPRSGSTDQTSSPGLCLSVPKARMQATLGGPGGLREHCYCGVCTCGLWGSHGSLLSAAPYPGWMVRGKGIRRWSGPSVRMGISEQR